MKKFQIGDTVRVQIIDSIYDQKLGKVIGYLDLGSGNIKPTVELPKLGIVYFREEELELVETVVEYEYAVQKTYSHAARSIKWDEWTDEKTARARFDAFPKEQNYDPTWGTFTVKVVKRRKAGRIEDV